MVSDAVIVVEEMPWASALPELSEFQLARLAGTAMHVAAIGLVWAYTFAFTDIA